MKRFITIILLISLSVFTNAENKAKYVFYFIGDGMGFDHVSIAEYYQANKAKMFGSMPLCFSNFPVFGNAVTHSASNLITDSAAAGTALATGTKTKNGMLSMGADSTTILTSIAEKIHNQGYKVGISSTVGINHATPAAFYGHSVSRSNYYDIAMEMCDSDFEFFGGGGIIDYKGNGRKSVYKYMEKAGYNIVEGLTEFDAVKGKCDKIMLLQKDGKELTHLPYAIDKREGDMTQADIVRAAIEVLYNEGDNKGFFLMSEGGKIDWASHANDSKATILEVLSFSGAVEAAMEFYRQHPDETLIVVTSDHETGGFTMCYENGYNVHFNHLLDITKSKDFMDEEEKATANAASGRARLGWTSSDHSGANVPVYAIGAGSEYFSGRMDNTDIPYNICMAMGVEF